MTALDPERHKQYELEVHKEIWRATVYDRHRLQKDLLRLYLKAGEAYHSRRLPDAYLVQVIEGVGHIYEEEFPPELPEVERDRHIKKLDDWSVVYTCFLQAFLKALVAFTQAFPDDASIPLTPKPEPLFTTPLPVFTEEEEFTPELQAAFEALKKPLDDAAEDFTKHHIFNRADFIPFGWYKFRDSRPDFDESYFTEREPYWGDKYERAAWRERKREHDTEQKRRKRDFHRPDMQNWAFRKELHEEAYDQAHEQTKPWEETFHHTPFHRHEKCLIPDINVPFHIPDHIWFQGTWVVGAPNSGKTNLLRHLVLNLNKEASVIVLDAKGELYRSFSRLATVKDRLVLIEPDLEYPPQLNPLDMGKNATEFLSYLFSILGTEFTQYQQTFFDMLASLVSRVPNATLNDVLRIIRGEDYSEYLVHCEPEVQDFFKYDINDRLYRDRKPELIARIQTLLRNKYIKAMFLTRENRLNIGQLMDEGKIVLIDNTYNPDKLGENGCEFFGRVIIAMIWSAARRRAPLRDDRKRPVFVVMDEAHFVIQNDITIKKIINQCRSQKIAMVFAHQEVSDIKQPDTLSALTGTAIKFFSSTGEAHELAPRLSPETDPTFIANLNRGTFAVKVGPKPPAHISVEHIRHRSDHTLLDHPCIPDHEFHALRLTMRARYCMGVPEPSPPSYDVFWECTISPKLAREGGYKIVHQLKIKIPPNTRHGTRMRLKDKGAMKPDGTYADAYLTIHIGGHREQERLRDIKDDD